MNPTYSLQLQVCIKHACTQLEANRIRGYQEGSTTAFYRRPGGKEEKEGMSINHAYVDGISLTYGPRPANREHIWTFASSVTDNTKKSTKGQCPCLRNSRAKASQKAGSEFVEHDYFCDSGNFDADQAKEIVGKLFLGDTLWDGKGCAFQNGCCKKQRGSPWFTRRFDPFCEDIDMRVCTDEGNEKENILIDQMEIYVQWFVWDRTSVGLVKHKL